MIWFEEIRSYFLSRGFFFLGFLANTSVFYYLLSFPPPIPMPDDFLAASFDFCF